MSLKIDYITDVCMFLNITDLYIGNKINENNTKFESIIFLNNKFYLKKHIQYDEDYYEIIIEPLYHPKLQYFNESNGEDKLLTIKDDILISYKIIQEKEIKECELLLYEKDDVILVGEWIDTLEASKMIDPNFYEKYKDYVFFQY
jgi:CRISPR/Cas system-associated protein Cas5 (RAMP superfamily)